MADKKIENEQELEEAKPLSFFDEKMKGLLDELDERLEQIGGDFGPILMEELQNRLENIARNFNIRPEKIFFVGDTATDIKTAKNAMRKTLAK